MSSDGISGCREKEHVSNSWNEQQSYATHLETLAGTDPRDKRMDLGALFERRALHHLPMIEHVLGECLALRSLTQITGKAERLHDRQVRLDREHGRAGTLLFREHLPTALVQARVDTANSVLRALNLDQVDRLLQRRLREQARGVGDTARGWQNLTTATVNGIGVQNDIHDVDPYTAHRLLSTWAFLRCPLERSDDAVNSESAYAQVVRRQS